MVERQRTRQTQSQRAKEKRKKKYAASAETQANALESLTKGINEYEGKGGESSKEMKERTGQ